MYVGLRAGLTVSPSIPISVLSISILRAFGKVSILENNIVQTTGSAGETIAAGVIFTLPALIFLGYPLEYWGVFFLALIGGCIGACFMMIPLRRQLIVKEHGNLLFPEGTACADVLVAGDRGGSFAGRVFWGLGLGGLYSVLMNTVNVWRDTPSYQPRWLPGAEVSANVTPEYLGVGYIIGPRIAGIILSGGVFSWLVLMPAIRFFGSLAPGLALYPSTIPNPVDDSGSALGQLRPPDRRGRGSRGRRHHPGQNCAHHLVGPHRRNQGHAQGPRRPGGTPRCGAFAH